MVERCCRLLGPVSTRCAQPLKMLIVTHILELDAAKLAGPACVLSPKSPFRKVERQPTDFLTKDEQRSVCVGVPYHRLVATTVLKTFSPPKLHRARFRGGMHQGP